MSILRFLSVNNAGIETILSVIFGFLKKEIYSLKITFLLYNPCVKITILHSLITFT